jgi:hypothetical protein
VIDGGKCAYVLPDSTKVENRNKKYLNPKPKTWRKSVSKLQQKFLQNPVDTDVLEEGDPDYELAVSSLKYQIKDNIKELFFIGMKPSAIFLLIAGIYNEIAN